MCDMSFMKFLQSKKNKPDIKTSIESYRENLEQEVSSKLFDPDKANDFLLENIVEATNIEKQLINVSYPYINELLIAISARNLPKLRNAYAKFQEWVKNNPELENVESTLLEIKSYLYGSKRAKYSKELFNNIVNYYLESTSNNINKMSAIIEAVVENIENWKGSTVTIEAVKGSDFTCNNFKVYVGNSDPLTFVINLKDKKVSKIEDIDGKSFNTQEDYLNLLSGLNAKSKSFNTFYFTASPKQRENIQRIKRDISLGIKSTLPQNIDLYENVPNDCKDDVLSLIHI